LYNLFERGIEAAVLPTSARCGLGQLVYSPLAQGVLTGKYEPGKPPPAGTRAADERANQFVGRFLTDDRVRQAQRLAQLAQAHGLTATQAALAFCLRPREVSSVLVGARDEAQLAGSLAAVAVELPAPLLAALQQEFPA
ncbi:MAG: aldo/keto reductase, partial [Planctomycetota bacterium]